jgi:hypothetical protein
MMVTGTGIKWGKGEMLIKTPREYHSKIREEWHIDTAFYLDCTHCLYIRI